jgi:nicotinate-nucleotide pyrophosphorylase (carboxylating)
LARENPNQNRLLRLAVAEDLGAGDVTSEAIIPKGRRVRGFYVAKGRGVVAGLPFVADVFDAFGKGVKVRLLAEDGLEVRPGAKLAEVRGPARTILSGERLSLNLLCHLSGVATLTAQYVKRTAGTRARIYDTRKTTPGLRHLEKYAVVVGGGLNHRLGLHDAVLMKDNHLALAGTSITGAVERARKHTKRMKWYKKSVEVEVTNLAGLAEAVRAGADIVMLDNFTPARAAAAVKRARALAKERGRPVEIEISGGVNLKNVRAYARANPDRISVGALTHSAPALDISLELERAP